MSIPATMGLSNLAPEIMAQLELSDFAILHRLAHYYHEENKKCHVGFEKIIETCPVSRRQIPISMNRLQNLGLITMRKGQGKMANGGVTNAYDLHWEFDYGYLKGSALKDKGSAVVAKGSAVTAPEIGLNRLSRKESVGFSSGVIEEIYNLVWKEASEASRKRSSKKLLQDAIRARGRDGASREDLLAGALGYFRDRENFREGGKFQKGAHRVFSSGVWEQYVEEGPRIDERAPDTAPIVSAEAKSPPISQAYQRRYMELDAQGLPWDVHMRGPRPGLPGCRISDTLLREFGYEPYKRTEAPVINLDDEVLD